MNNAAGAPGGALAWAAGGVLPDGAGQPSHRTPAPAVWGSSGSPPLDVRAVPPVRWGSPADPYQPGQALGAWPAQGAGLMRDGPTERQRSRKTQLETHRARGREAQPRVPAIISPRGPLSRPRWDLDPPAARTPGTRASCAAGEVAALGSSVAPPSPCLGFPRSPRRAGQSAPPLPGRGQHPHVCAGFWTAA